MDAAERQNGRPLMTDARKTRFLPLLAALACLLLPGVGGAQPLISGGSWTFTPSCPPSGARVVIEIEQRYHNPWDATPMRPTLPGGPPTATSIVPPGAPWRQIAGLGTPVTDPFVQGGYLRELHYVALASEVGPLLRGGEGEPIPLTVSAGPRTQPGALISSWVPQNGEVRLQELFASWPNTGDETRYLHTDTYPGAPPYVPTSLHSRSVRSPGGYPFVEFVHLYCVSAARYARPPVVDPEEDPSADGTGGPWDTYLYRDWCGRWTCENRWYGVRTR